MKLYCEDGFGGFVIKGHMRKGEVYDVPDEVAEYLLATHPEKFQRAHGNTKAVATIEADKGKAYAVARRELSEVRIEGKKKVRTATGSEKEIKERADELWKGWMNPQA